MNVLFLVHGRGQPVRRWYADLLEKKIVELEKRKEIVEKLDAHYGFFYFGKML